MTAFLLFVALAAAARADVIGRASVIDGDTIEVPVTTANAPTPVALPASQPLRNYHTSGSSLFIAGS